jgi:hypothetical protein
VNDQHPNLSLPESKIQSALVINPTKKSLHTVKVFGKVVSAKSQTALYLEQNSNTQVGAIVFLWPTPYALCSVQRETGR